MTQQLCLSLGAQWISGGCNFTNTSVLYAAWTQLADPASDLLGGDEKFHEYLNSVNYTASLNDLLTECNKSWERLSSSNDPLIEFEYTSLKSKDFTCQKFIETLVKEYNKNKDEHHLEGYIRL
ncbi:MAG: hypothetical protein IIV74_00820 [Alphaproteobacteria bacterium]|nr:hypothetical protein [Alphaproteobacteria bacterium]